MLSLTFRCYDRISEEEVSFPHLWVHQWLLYVVLLVVHQVVSSSVVWISHLIPSSYLQVSFQRHQAFQSLVSSSLSSPLVFGVIHPSLEACGVSLLLPCFWDQEVHHRISCSVSRFQPSWHYLWFNLDRVLNLSVFAFLDLTSTLIASAYQWILS